MKVKLDLGGHFKVGDPMPDGYVARQEWADVHIKAGLKQEVCAACCRFFFPHQLSPEIHKRNVVRATKGGKKRFENVTLTHRYCIGCTPPKPKDTSEK